MKIKVDFDLCESNALCEALAPEVFELDDDDFLQLKTEETTDDEHRERQASRRGLPARRHLPGGMTTCLTHPSASTPAPWTDG